MSSNDLAPGLKGQVETIVTDEDLACALGSGDVPVLGTPRMIALAEAATVRAIARALGEGQTSVGTRIDISHLAASPTGTKIKATADLAQVHGKALTFRVEVQDDQGLVAEGTVERFVVDREKFIARANLPRRS